jgi:hypothetical protein
MKIKKFGFDVGDSERHRVEVHFNQTLGPLRISVDGNLVVRKFLMFSLSTVRRYELKVGLAETHDVVIEKTRERVLGGVRPQVFTVIVDGQEQGTY